MCGYNEEEEEPAGIGCAIPPYAWVFKYPSRAHNYWRHNEVCVQIRAPERVGMHQMTTAEWKALGKPEDTPEFRQAEASMKQAIAEMRTAKLAKAHQSNQRQDK